MADLTLPLHSSKKDELVLVKLWEAYLLYHPANLYRILTSLSADNGPVADEKSPGRVTFRFGRTDWENKVQPLLHKYRIPVLNQMPRNGRNASLREPALR